MADEPGWAIPWDGDTLIWHGIEDLTASRLRHFKQWYGPDYGKAHTFNLLFLQMDVDAVCCIIWALLKDKGKAPDTPNSLPDFSVGSIAANTVFTEDPTGPDETPDTPDPRLDRDIDELRGEAIGRVAEFANCPPPILDELPFFDFLALDSYAQARMKLMVDLAVISGGGTPKP